MSIHIGFVVDHPKRDLPGAVVLARAAACRGVTLSIIPMYEQAIDVPLLGLDALIVNYARPANNRLLEGYHAFGLPVFVLDTEGGILAESGANSLSGLPRAIRESGVGRCLSGYMLWGPRLRDAFLQASGIEAGKLHVTGCPRFDFASPRWSGTLHYPRSGYVLVNANFPLVNSRFSQSPEQEAATLVRSGWAPEYVSVILAQQKRIHRDFLATIAEAAAKRPDTSFLVRPHPFERDDVYAQAFRELPNVQVDGAGGVLNVIQNARCVLHLNCGTSVEAVMLNRIPISLEFLNTETMRTHSPLPSAISRKAGSVAELLHILDNLDSEAAVFPFADRYETFIHAWFYKNDGMAAERVLDVVTQTVGTGTGRRPVSLRHSLGAIRPDSRAAQYAQAALANLLGSFLSSRLRGGIASQRTEKYFSVEEIRTALAELTRVENAKNPRVSRARHPLSGMPLSTVRVLPSL